MSRRVRRSAFIVALAATLGVVSPAFAASSGTVTTTLGQTMSAAITAPADQAHFTVGSNVTVNGTVSLTGGPVVPTNVAYVIDVSGSTVADCKPLDPSDARTVLDCEQEGAIALNSSMSSTPSLEAGVISFDTSSVIDQTFVAPSSPLIGTAINGLTPGGSTNYDAALTNVSTLFTGVPVANRKVVFFLSDGDPTDFTTGPGSPLALVDTAGIVVNTYSIGDGSLRCPDPGSALQLIATTTGGVCNDVADPSTLAANLSNARVEVKMNGKAPVPAQVSGNNFTVNFSSTNSNTVILGDNPIIATAVAPDGTRLEVNITIIGDPLPTTTTTTSTTVRVVQVTPRFTG